MPQHDLLWPENFHNLTIWFRTGVPDFDLIYPVLALDVPLWLIFK